LALSALFDAAWFMWLEPAFRQGPWGFIAPAAGACRIDFSGAITIPLARQKPLMLSGSSSRGVRALQGQRP
jgi:hypothetical protein